ncbi:MAG: hypothetical protein KKA90_00560 [Nanoarchaeota archaeon]|nr:hypothetical protein [Nanoarchaeota archaeon]
MKLTVLEKDKNHIAVQFSGETHTLLNLLVENAWKAGATQAATVMEHPYLEEPKLVIHGPNPQKILTDAATMAVAEAKEFQSVFKKAVK